MHVPEDAIDQFAALAPLECRAVVGLRGAKLVKISKYLLDEFFNLQQEFALSLVHERIVNGKRLIVNRGKLDIRTGSGSDRVLALKSASARLLKIRKRKVRLPDWTLGSGR